MKFFKGQYFSFDAIIASVIFVLALVALLSYWHSVKSFLDYQNDPLSKDAIRISNLLFIPSSPSPDCATIERLGFAMSWADKRINSSLFNCAVSHNNELDSNGYPNWLHEKLGTPYLATLEITNVSDGNSFYLGQDPDNLPVGTINVVKIRRLGTVIQPDGLTYLVRLDLTLYR